VIALFQLVAPIVSLLLSGTIAIRSEACLTPLLHDLACPTKRDLELRRPPLFWCMTMA